MGNSMTSENHPIPSSSPSSFSSGTTDKGKKTKRERQLSVSVPFFMNWRKLKNSQDYFKMNYHPLEVHDFDWAYWEEYFNLNESDESEGTVAIRTKSASSRGMSQTATLSATETGNSKEDDMRIDIEEEAEESDGNLPSSSSSSVKHVGSEKEAVAIDMTSPKKSDPTKKPDWNEYSNYPQFTTSEQEDEYDWDDGEWH